MDMKQLEYFLVLCEQQHMSGAAAMLGISQPALSKSIASLEKELGVQLFDRHGNSIRLNNYGYSYAAYARKALENLSNGERVLNQHRYDMVGEIRILCHAFFDAILDAVTAYTALNPNVKINVGLSRGREESILENFDFLLGSAQETLSSAGEEKIWYPATLFHEAHYILISPRYRSYPEETVELDFSSLSDDLFIDLPDLSSLFYVDITHRLAYSSGFAPKIYCSTEDFVTKLQLVDAGKAICVLPGCCLRVAKKLSPDVRIFSIRNYDTGRSICLNRKKKSRMSETALDFWDFVLDYYNVKEDGK